MLDPYSQKIVVLGDPDVGKTHLQTIFSLARSSYWVYGIRYPMHGTFFNIVYFPFADIEFKVYIWDLPDHRDHVSPKYFENASGALVVYDITNRKSFENLGKWKEELLSHFHTIPCVLVGNKKDLESSRTISENEGIVLAQKWNVPFFETSTKKRLNIRACFSKLVHNTLMYHRILETLKELENFSPLSDYDLSKFAVKILEMNGYLGEERIPHIKDSLKKALRKQIVNSLIQACLSDEHAYIRSSSANALSAIGAVDKEVIKSLSHALLQDEHWHVRSSVANTLGELGATEESINLLSTALLHDENEFVRKSAAGALGKIDDKRAIPSLVKALKDEKGVVRIQAFETLIKFGYETSADEKLLLLLEDETNFDQIINLVKKNPQTLQDIFFALKNSDIDITAAKTLGKIGVEIPSTVERVLPQLFEATNKNVKVRKKIIWSLCRIAEKKEAEQIVLRLVNFLKDENSDIRCETIKAMGEISVKFPEIVKDVGAIPILTNLLKEKKGKVQKCAAETLVKWIMSQSISLTRKGKIENAFELMITNIDGIIQHVQPTNFRSIANHFIPFFIQEASAFFSTLLVEELWKGFQYKLKKLYFAPLKSVASVKAGLEEITKTLCVLEKII